MKLFQAHTGYNDPHDPSGGFYEVHSVMFVCARNITAARIKLKNLKDFKKYKMHIDAIKELSTVDGHKIKLEKI